MKTVMRQRLWALLIMAAAVSCETIGEAVDSGDVGSNDNSSSDNSSSSTWVDPDGVTEWIDEMLCERYLYNEAYAALEDRDLEMDFDDFFYENLTSLKGINTLDYKQLSETYGGEWSLFSYIEGTSPSGETRSSYDTATDYGFINATIVTDSNSIHGFYVLAVYNDSPADKAGIRRGMVITKINGSSITESNYSSLFYSLLYPTAGATMSLTVYTSGEGSSELSITTASYDMNPVLRCEVIDEENSVGYLNYILFNSEYDNKMQEAFELLSSEEVEHLILDLRDNLGGYVSSASIMTSAITSTAAGSSQIFSYYRLNDDLSEAYSTTKLWTGLNFDESSSLFYEPLSGIDSSCHLDKLTSKTIYCLVNYNTASASEMVINALRGMGYTVVLIGETTRGKNVGMYIFEKSFDDYDYELAPITFENLNCLQEGGYEDGLEPTYTVTTQESLEGFYDFSADEPLIKEALSLITGSSNKRAVTRSSESETEQVSLIENTLKMPTRGIYGAMKQAK